MLARESINAVFRNDEFTDFLVGAIDASLPAFATAQDRESARLSIFQGLIASVARNVRDHPARSSFISLVNDAGITSDDAFNAFDFIYSGILNHFKGELAELLAKPILNSFLELVAVRREDYGDVELLIGSDLRTPKRPGYSASFKNADALLVVSIVESSWLGESAPNSPGQIVVIGAAEIKSKRESLTKTFQQLDGHISRLALGASIKGKAITADQLLFPVLKPGCKSQSLTSDATSARASVERLVVRPCLSSREPQQLKERRPREWVAEIALTAGYLLEASFQFTRWFTAQLGAGHEILDVCIQDPSRCTTEVTSLRLAEDRLMEAMYHFCRRTLLEGLQTKYPRAVQTVHWLYNCFGYGRHGATGDRVQWPEERSGVTASPPAGDDNSVRILDRAWDAYGCGRLREALKDLEEAREVGLPGKHVRRAAWLESMIAFRDGRYSDALRLFPEPEAKADSIWWPRDRAMLVRLNARVGNTECAYQHIQGIGLPDRFPNRGFAVEYYGVSSLTWFTKGDERKAIDEANKGLSVYDALAAEWNKRVTEKLGEPWDIEPNTVQMGVFDLAAVLTSCNQLERAINILTRLSGFVGWEIPYLKRDPLLAALFRKWHQSSPLSTWLATAEREQ